MRPIISREALEQVAHSYPRQDPGSNTAREQTRSAGRSIDLETWLDGHGIGFQKRPWQSGTIFLFDTCPFSDAHQDGAYAIQFRSGAIFAGCHHTSCGGGAQRWQELRIRYDGPDQRSGDVRERRTQGQKKHRTTEDHLREQGPADQGGAFTATEPDPLPPRNHPGSNLTYDRQSLPVLS